jgi:hypothetical protein
VNSIKSLRGVLPKWGGVLQRFKFEAPGISFEAKRFNLRPQRLKREAKRVRLQPLRVKFEVKRLNAGARKV